MSTWVYDSEGGICDHPMGGTSAPVLVSPSAAITLYIMLAYSYIEGLRMSSGLFTWQTDGWNSLALMMHGRASVWAPTTLLYDFVVDRDPAIATLTLLS